RAAVDPADVGGQRADVVLGEEAAEGCHLDRLATEEERADQVLGDSPDLALRDPVPELLVAAHEVVEVRTPEARHVALERARVGHAAGAERTVAGEAAELRGEIGGAGGVPPGCSRARARVRVRAGRRARPTRRARA